ncbi:MAG: hypothetical protein AB2748_18255 [Candidatus Thiodiazotropha endolucinida]
MNSRKSKQEIWQREKALAKRPDIWKSFAVETRCCAEFLLAKFETASHTNEPLKTFFAYKYVRMLKGYSLENLIKGLLLSGPRKEKYIKADRISFGKKGHDVKWLLEELEYSIDDEQGFFIDTWSVSAEWFGKYPFPIEMNRVLDEYQSLSSSESILRRSLRGKRDFIPHDLLHQQIGLKEIQVYETLFGSIINLYEA